MGVQWRRFCYSGMSAGQGHGACCGSFAAEGEFQLIKAVWNWSVPWLALWSISWWWMSEQSLRHATVLFFGGFPKQVGISVWRPESINGPHGSWEHVWALHLGQLFSVGSLSRNLIQCLWWWQLGTSTSEAVGVGDIILLIFYSTKYWAHQQGAILPKFALLPVIAYTLCDNWRVSLWLDWDSN